LKAVAEALPAPAGAFLSATVEAVALFAAAATTEVPAGTRIVDDGPLAAAETEACPAGALVDDTVLTEALYAVAETGIAPGVAVRRP
jgi:hypothetical protein